MFHLFLLRRIERFKNTLDKIASLGRNSIFKDKALAEMQARKRSGNAVDDCMLLMLVLVIVDRVQ